MDNTFAALKDEELFHKALTLEPHDHSPKNAENQHDVLVVTYAAAKMALIIRALGHVLSEWLTTTNNHSAKVQWNATSPFHG